MSTPKSHFAIERGNTESKTRHWYATAFAEGVTHEDDARAILATLRKNSKNHIYRLVRVTREVIDGEE